jgi:hypothetical protein
VIDPFNGILIPGKIMCSESLRHLAKQRRATHLFLGAIRGVMRNNNYKPNGDSPLSNDATQKLLLRGGLVRRVA